MRNHSVWKLLGMILLPVTLIVSVAAGSAYWFFNGSYDSDDQNLNIKAAERVDDIAENHSLASDLNDKSLYNTYVFPTPLAATYDKATSTATPIAENVTKTTEKVPTGEYTTVVDETSKTDYGSFDDIKNGNIDTASNTIYSINITTSSDNNKGSKFDLYYTKDAWNDNYCFCTSSTSYKGSSNIPNYLYYISGKCYYSIWQGYIKGIFGLAAAKNVSYDQITLNTVTIYETEYTDKTQTAPATITLTPGSSEYKNSSDNTKAFKCDSTGKVYVYDVNKVPVTDDSYVWSNGLEYTDPDNDGIWTATSEDGITHYWDEANDKYTYSITASTGGYVNPKLWYDTEKYPGSATNGCYWSDSSINYKSVLNKTNCLKAQDITSLGEPSSNMGTGYKFCGYTADKEVAEANWNSLSSTPTVGDVELYNSNKPFSYYDALDGNTDNNVFLYPLFLSSSTYSLTVGGVSSYMVKNGDGLYQRTCLVKKKLTDMITVNGKYFIDILLSLDVGDMYNVYVCEDASLLSEKNILVSTTSSGFTVAIEKVYAHKIMDRCNTGTFSYDDSAGISYQSTGLVYSGGTCTEVLTSNEMIMSDKDKLQFVINSGITYDSSVITYSRDVTATGTAYECTGYDENGKPKTYTDEGGNTVYYQYDGNVIDPVEDSSFSDINPENLPVYKFTGASVFKVRAEITYTDGKPSAVKVSAARLRGIFVELHIQNSGTVGGNFNLLGKTSYIDHSINNPGSNGVIYRCYLDYGDSLTTASEFYKVGDSSSKVTLAGIWTNGLLSSSNELYDHVLIDKFRITSSGIYVDNTLQSAGYTLNKNYVFYLGK